MEDQTSGTPVMDDPHGVVVTGEVESLTSVADDHDHAEGRGLPVVRALGDVGAGPGLIQPGAIVMARTLAEVVAWGAGWTQETSLAGLLPIGVGTTFSQTFVEATSYGVAWSHLHGDDHWHGGPLHHHTGPNHQHTGPSHNHTGPNHNHTGPSHTHTGPSHTHASTGLTATLGSILADVVHIFLASGTSGTTNVSTADHTHASPSITMGGSTAAEGTGATGAAGTGATGDAGTGATGDAGTGLSGLSGTGDTGDAGNGVTGNKAPTGSTDATSWLPPARGVVWARKL